ncbi:MAG: hypothetical protein ONB47_13115 [candidate division KSB1 bacterium]|nr:hypothetical protein [candidate division KSB1 bacterium]
MIATHDCTQKHENTRESFVRFAAERLTDWVAAMTALCLTGSLNSGRTRAIGRQKLALTARHPRDTRCIERCQDTVDFRHLQGHCIGAGVAQKASGSDQGCAPNAIRSAHARRHQESPRKYRRPKARLRKFIFIMRLAQPAWQITRENDHSRENFRNPESRRRTQIPKISGN